MISSKIYNSKANEQKWFIIFDGTSRYEELGMDIQQDIDWGDIEPEDVVEGPYDDGEFLDARVEQLNDEAYGTKMNR